MQIRPIDIPRGDYAALWLKHQTLRRHMARAAARMRAVAWLAQQNAASPGGIVPVQLVPRITRTQRQRVAKHIRAGTLPVIDGTAAGLPGWRFVRLVDVLNLPTIADLGRRLRDQAAAAVTEPAKAKPQK